MYINDVARTNNEDYLPQKFPNRLEKSNSEVGILKLRGVKNTSTLNKGQIKMMT